MVLTYQGFGIYWRRPPTQLSSGLPIIKMSKAPSEKGFLPTYRREELGRGVRGKYYQVYTKGTNLVLLSPDVAAVFPTSEAVNEALRLLIRVAQAAARSSRRVCAASHSAPPEASEN